MKLILINGLPATGKTTISKRLGDELDIPVISKDMIKEFLFDVLGIKDREQSKAFGRLANDFLYEICEAYLSKGKSIIIENSFEYEFAKPRIEEIAKKYSPELIEIYCTTAPSTRRKRFKERNESGNRHPGHFDEANYMADAEPEPLEKYAPIGIGSVIKIKTDTTDNEALHKLIQTIDY